MPDKQEGVFVMDELDDFKPEPLYSGPLQADAPHVGRTCIRCGKLFRKHDMINVHYLSSRATVTVHSSCLYNPVVGVEVNL